MAYKDPEAKRAYNLAYAAAHKAEKAVKNHAYHAAHKEEIHVKKLAYVATNKGAIAAKDRAYHAANRAARQAKSRAYYATHREEALAKKRSYLEAKHDEINARRRALRANCAPERTSMRRAYMQAYGCTHRQEIAASKRLYALTHPEMVQGHKQQRRARKKGAPRNDLTPAQWITIQETQNHCCAYCGKRCKGRLTQDHITPLSKGGSHTLHNVIGACRSCNSQKHTGPPLTPVQPLLLDITPAKKKKAS